MKKIVFTAFVAVVMMACKPTGDYKAWAKGLKKAGYATDPNYPDKLISYIERYNLHQYDCQVTGKSYKPFEKSTPVRSSSVSSTAPLSSNSNDPNLYEVQKGDTLYSISKKFNVFLLLEHKCKGYVVKEI